MDEWLTIDRALAVFIYAALAGIGFLFSLFSFYFVADMFRRRNKTRRQTELENLFREARRHERTKERGKGA